MIARRLLAPVVLAFVAWLARGTFAAQSAQPAAPSYRAEQARQGQTLYYVNCAQCHGAMLEGRIGPALAGGDGNVQWESVSYVWNYALGHMPEGNAGGLPHADYVAIIAFLLKMHGHPAGASPLTEASANAAKALFGP
jgi:mono/diheme cytochrome c family protein